MLFVSEMSFVGTTVQSAESCTLGMICRISSEPETEGLIIAHHFWAAEGLIVPCLIHTDFLVDNPVKLFMN
jgi:hypothetical protein